MSNNIADFILPSNPADRRAITDAIYEIVGANREIKDKRSYIGDTKKMLKEKYGLKPKLVSKYVKTITDQNFTEVVAETEAFTETYEILFERGSPAPVTSPTDENE